MLSLQKSDPIFSQCLMINIPNHILAKFGTQNCGVCVPTSQLKILQSEHRIGFSELLIEIQEFGKFETLQDWSILTISLDAFRKFEEAFHLTEAFAMIRSYSFEFFGYHIFLEIESSLLEKSLNDEFQKIAGIRDGEFNFRDLCWLFGKNMWHQKLNNLRYLPIPQIRNRRLSAFANLQRFLPRKARILRYFDVLPFRGLKATINSEDVKTFDN